MDIKTNNYIMDIRKQLNNIISNSLLINNKQIENLSKLIEHIIKHRSRDKIIAYKIDKYNINIELVYGTTYVITIINIFYKNKLYKYINFRIINNNINNIIIDSKILNNIRIEWCYIYKNNNMYFLKHKFNNTYKCNINYKIEYNYNNYKMINYYISNDCIYKRFKKTYIIYIEYKIYYIQINKSKKKIDFTDTHIINYLLNKQNINKILI